MIDNLCLLCLPTGALTLNCTPVPCSVCLHADSGSSMEAPCSWMSPVYAGAAGRCTPAAGPCTSLQPDCRLLQVSMQQSADVRLRRLGLRVPSVGNAADTRVWSLRGETPTSDIGGRSQAETSVNSKPASLLLGGINKCLETRGYNECNVTKA